MFSQALPAPAVIGAVDVNGDGHTDITFRNSTSGTIVSTQPLDGTCPFIDPDRAFVGDKPSIRGR